MRAALLVALAFSACAPGADGLRQACANADDILTNAYRLDTATMKETIAVGKAAQYARDFEIATASIDTAAGMKATACASTATDSKGWADLAAKVAAAGADATAAIAKLVAAVKGGV